MNTVSEQLLSAIDILTEEKISKLNFDKTIKAQVYNIINLDTGEYKVKYSGNIFSAFASDVTKQYSIGDSVYVTVPEGDFSNKKIISSLVSEQSLSYSQLMALQQSINGISPTFDKFYNYDATGIYGVIAGAEVGSAASQAYIYQGPDEYSVDQYHGLFQQYANTYELIRIKASFLTTLQSEHTQGNYGIEIEFYTKSDGVVSYKLDLSSFNGDPYQFSVYSPQYVVIKAQTNYLLGVKSIKLFEENFEYDRYLVNGIESDEINDTNPNIFVKDVQIQYVEAVDLTDNLYYLNISAPKGNSITSYISSIDLVGQLIYQGESIMDSSNCVCKWYKRDLSVMIGSDNYDKDAGFGWRSVTGDFNLLTLDSSDIPYQGQYKLIVTYKDTNVLSAQINVFNLTSAYKYELVQTTSGDDIQLQLRNNYNNEVLVADWYLSYPDGSYTQVTDGKKQNTIQIKDYLLYTSITFYCAVYSYDGSTIVGTLEQTITNSESADDITITYTGDDSFRYDANGDVTIEDSEKERTLQVNLTWKDGVGTSYRVEWVGPDGSLLSNSRYSPIESMIDNLWIDNSNILHYTIKQKYKVNYNNNTIQVRIITIDEQTYTFSKEILFLKDGDQGTNGTTYITAIRPCDSNGNKLSGLQPLIYNGGWRNTLPVKCYVYKDGELLNNNSNYDLEYKWTGINVTLSAEDASQIVLSGQGSVSTATAAANLEFFVKVQVTVNDKMNGEKTHIYASYPIDVAVGGIDYSKVDISDIPSYIKYTSSGVNPSFYSNDINFLYEENNLTSSITSLNTTILDIEEDEGLYYLKPASSFIYEKVNSDDSNIGILKCNYSTTQYILHPIVMYLDTYGNEAINGWDGTSIETEDGHIFAPQIGAGEKDSYNRFTGVVMGKDSEQDNVGLYGYQSGVNTFGLMEDGTAYFGAKSGGGQITIYGKSAIIKGGDVTVSSSGSITAATNGMYLRLADKNIAGTTKAIGIGYDATTRKENFYVQYNGNMYASNADIQGAIYATSGQIGGSGRSGGWTISSGKIYSDNGSGYVELNSNISDTYAIQIGSSTSSNAKFLVSKGGLVTAKEGAIGGWKLFSNKFTASTGKIGLASSGANGYRIWVNADAIDGTETESTNPTFSGGTYFWVNSSGKMSCKNAEVRGSIYADSGTIGDWTISNSRLQNSDGSVYLSATGFKLGDNFFVSDSGKLTANSASLDSATLTKATVTGSITATQLSCTKGSIGGWTISSSGIASGDTTLTSTGLIKTQQVSIYSDTKYLGYLGYVEGEDDAGVTDNIGIKTETSGQSIILSSSRNIALRPSGTIYLNGTGLVCNIAKAKQSGIYAQFA